MRVNPNRDRLVMRLSRAIIFFNIHESTGTSEYNQSIKYIAAYTQLARGEVIRDSSK